MGIEEEVIHIRSSAEDVRYPQMERVDLIFESGHALDPNQEVIDDHKRNAETWGK